jgi:CheY-like chemotaxis protein
MKKVVVVDDDTKVNLVIGNTLEQLGFQVFIATNGKKALELVTEHNPDLLIADILIPGIDGVALCGMVKNTPELQKTKVILMTGIYKSPSFRSELDNNADAFIEKPIDVEKLALLVSEHISELNKK